MLVKNLFRRNSLIAVLCFLSALATAQSYTMLYCFTNYINAPLLATNTLYGTTWDGGTNGQGTVFALSADGTRFETIYTFSTLSAPQSEGGTNGDGANPAGGLILSGNTLFGTATAGGDSGNGTVFRVNLDGSCFSNLHSFSPSLADPLIISDDEGEGTITNSDGANPRDALVLSGDTLYGVAWNGGPEGNGTIFSVKTDGSNFTVLHGFTALEDINLRTNSDGGDPNTPMLLSGSTLYGTTLSGGSSGGGTIFRINTDGTGFTNVYDFIGNGGVPWIYDLVLSGNTFYGTLQDGGGADNGSVFSVNIDGTGFTNLYSFSPANINYEGSQTNYDGVSPQGLVLSGNTLYGTARYGGSFGNGTVFSVDTDGTEFKKLYEFTGGPGGVKPASDVILSGNALYGTALGEEGFAGDGSATLFSITLPPPQLSLTLSGNNAILSWPTNFAGLTLQSAKSLISPVLWTTITSSPAVINALNVLTNTVSGNQTFYRLSQ